MDSKRFTRRLVALGAAMFLCALVFVVTLFDAQIVNGDDYLAQSIRTNAKSETVKASRGVITDRNGKVLVSNRAVYTLNFDSSLVSSDELNDALLPRSGSTAILSMLHLFARETALSCLLLVPVYPALRAVRRAFPD